MTEKCQNIFLNINKMIEKRRIKLKNDYKNHFSDKTITKYTTKITPSPKIQNLSTFLSQKLAFSPAMFPDSSQKSFFLATDPSPRHSDKTPPKNESPTRRHHSAQQENSGRGPYLHPTAGWGGAGWGGDGILKLTSLAHPPGWPPVSARQEAAALFK